VAGECTVETRWQGGAASQLLNGPELALHVPAGTWLECRDFSPGAVLLVLCSNVYDAADQTTEQP
jgi:WxcM-like, C-terminal